jgi:heme A synthase
MASASLTAEPALPVTFTGTPRWLHAVAIATAVAALPLLFLGAEVTTKQVGLVDTEGVRQPWHLFTVLGEKVQERQWGFLIEHSHRTFGWLVGMCAITLAIGLGLSETRRWLRRLGWIALIAVTCQGILGILRVNLHALAGREFAMIHGCTAQLVFALLVGIAYLTSPSSTDRIASEHATDRLKQLSLLTAGLVYLQIVLGALVRHTDSVAGPRLHLLLAFGVVISATSLGACYWMSDKRDSRLARPIIILFVSIGLQLVLGVEAWLSKFIANAQWVQLKPLTAYPDLARSLHLLVGSLLFATSVVVSLRAHLGSSISTSAQAVPRLEGAA